MQPSILDAMRRGAYDEALVLARKAVRTAPGDVDALRLLALAQRATGDVQGGRDTLETAIALAPEDAALHLHHAGFLVGMHDPGAAGAALDAAVRLDPNRLAAYYLRAQLALGRNDVDEAERVAKLAARVDADHPWVLALQGTIALRRGQADDALAILARASTLAPDDVQVRHALGFAYLAKGHPAFAEQAFRGVLAAVPGATMLHVLIAGLLQQQGRMAEAAAELEPVFAAGRDTPALRRYLGELELVAGRPAQAAGHLRTAWAALPGDARTLSSLLQALRLTRDADGARAVLEEALALRPADAGLWQARLSIDSTDPEASSRLASRWVDAMPGHVPALQARMAVHANLGETDAARALADRVAALAPGDLSAGLLRLDALMERDPAAAVAHARALVETATEPGPRRLLRSYLALAHDRVGDVDAAVECWLALHRDVVAERLPLPWLSPVGTLGTARLEPGEPGMVAGAAAGSDAAQPVVPPEAGHGARVAAFLVGAPGSGVEQLARSIHANLPVLRADRFGAAPPDDAFQSAFSAQRLVDGELDPAAVAARWRGLLDARGPRQDAVDWLLWWDNAFAAVLSGHVPEALLLVAVRDPRDMLLDWLAFEAPVPLRFESATAAATWLASNLAHVAELAAHAFPALRLLRMDACLDDPAALAARVSEAMHAPLAPPPQGTLGPRRFASGHWRAYGGPLGDAFLILGPVAAQLGYPAD